MIYCNGQWLAEDAAAITVGDRGFLLGDGVFETLAASPSGLEYFDAHWQRLCQACEQLGIVLTLSKDTCQALINECITRNELTHTPRVAVRLTVSRGHANQRGLTIPVDARASVVISAAAYSRPASYPWRLIVYPYPLNERAEHAGLKTLNYLPNILAKRFALAHGADDAVMINTHNQVVSVSAGNIFCELNGCLITPSKDSGCLPGIMRQNILEKAKAQGQSVQTKALSVEELMSAQNLFVTNSLLTTQPVASVFTLD